MLVPQHQCDSLEALKLFSLDNVAEAAVAVLWEVPGTVMVKLFMGVHFMLVMALGMTWVMMVVVMGMLVMLISYLLLSIGASWR